MTIPYYTKISSAIIIAFALFFYSYDGSTNQTANTLMPVRITVVNDGDTVTIRYKTGLKGASKTERVRLIGIDAPELKQEPWGRPAKKHLKKLISRSDWLAYLELDIDQRDHYGRLLGYLWSNDKRQLINEQMVADGYAFVYTFSPNVKYAERFVKAQKSARGRKIGIWSNNRLKKLPKDWRKESYSKK